MRAESLDIHTARSATNQRTYQNPEAQYRATFSQAQLLVRRQRAVLVGAMIMALSLLIAVLATVDATILTLLRHLKSVFHIQSEHGGWLFKNQWVLRMDTPLSNTLQLQL